MGNVGGVKLQINFDELNFDSPRFYPAIFCASRKKIVHDLKVVVPRALTGIVTFAGKLLTNNRVISYVNINPYS